MKKIFILFVLVILLSGCEKEIVKTCKLEENGLGYKLKSEYNIYSTGKVVNKVVNTDVITSDKQNIIDHFEQTLNDSYYIMKKSYGGYDFNIKKENGILTSNVTINYLDVNMDKYLSDNFNMKEFITEDKKVLVEGLINYYKTMGYVCK